MMFIVAGISRLGQLFLGLLVMYTDVEEDARHETLSLLLFLFCRTSKVESATSLVCMDFIGGVNVAFTCHARETDCLLEG